MNQTNQKVNHMEERRTQSESQMFALKQTLKDFMEGVTPAKGHDHFQQ